MPDEEPTLQARLEEFFSQYGAVSAVRMRRDENKKFKPILNRSSIYDLQLSQSRLCKSILIGVPYTIRTSVLYLHNVDQKVTG